MNQVNASAYEMYIESTTKAASKGDDDAGGEYEI
jgi:hypothetical protein